MVTTWLLATAMTVKGIRATTGTHFHYQIASKVSECVIKQPMRAHSKAIKSLPSGLTLKPDSTLEGTVTAAEGTYTFGVGCKEKTFTVTIDVKEPE